MDATKFARPTELGDDDDDEFPIGSLAHPPLPLTSTVSIFHFVLFTTSNFAVAAGFRRRRRSLIANDRWAKVKALCLGSLTATKQSLSLNWLHNKITYKHNPLAIVAFLNAPPALSCSLVLVLEKWACQVEQKRGSLSFHCCLSCKCKFKYEQ